MKKIELSLGRAPAGDRGAAAADPTPGTVGQQAGCADADALGVIVANDRDRRTLAWLLGQVGAEAVRGAVGRLAGERRPYLSNVAKALSVALPDRLEVAPPGAHLDRLKAARNMLKASAAQPKGIARR